MWENISDETENRTSDHNMGRREARLARAIWTSGHIDEVGKNFVAENIYQHHENKRDNHTEDNFINFF